MKKTILGKNRELFEKEYQKSVAVFVVVLVVAAAFSLTTVLTYNHDKYYFTLFSNIFVDFCCIAVAFYVFDEKISPRSRKLKLFDRKNYGKRMRGEVAEISPYTQRNFSFDCYEVDVKTDSGIRKVFVEKNSFTVEVGRSYSFIVVDGIAVEVDDE